MSVQGKISTCFYYKTSNRNEEAVTAYFLNSSLSYLTYKVCFGWTSVSGESLVKLALVNSSVGAKKFYFYLKLSNLTLTETVLS